MGPSEGAVAQATKEVPSSDSSAAASTEKHVNPHWRRYKKVYRFFGFQKAYNFPLWIIFAVGMFAFCVAKLEDFHYPTLLINIGPGFNYYFGQGFRKYALLIHLASCLPAGILMLPQFTPIVRQKWMLFHRINGYVILLLCAITEVAGMILLNHNQTHMRLGTSAAEAFVGISSTISLALAWWNIKRLQIDQHRAWMLRSMFLMGTVATSRVTNEICSYIMTHIGGFYTLWNCDELAYVHREWGIMEIPRDQFPECYTPTATNLTLVAVEAIRDLNLPANLGSSFNGAYGAMLWLSIAVHVIGVEIYLNLTPAETQRLRKVSYERQLKAGMRKPGSAGITADGWGDSLRYNPDRYTPNV